MEDEMRNLIKTIIKDNLTLDVINRQYDAIITLKFDGEVIDKITVDN